jgi:hypothetical protein
MNGNVIMTGRLYADGVLVSEKVITTAFLEMLVDAMQAESGQLDNFNYHQSGTGTTAATATDTSLETAVGSRTAGSQTEGASAVVYRTSASISYANAVVGGITEWGLFDAVTGGNLLDRATLDAVTVSSLQTILWTFDLTFAAA